MQTANKENDRKMKKEAIGIGKTVEDAVAAALKEIGIDPEKVGYDAKIEHEVLEAPRRGFLGFGESPAKVKVTAEVEDPDRAVAFLRTVLGDMGIEAEITSGPRPDGEENERLITLSGEGVTLLIGHHGETLDALQYLTNLAVNRRDEDEKRDYTRITVDIENYRSKREATLRALADRMAARVKKTGRNVVLEPMTPYERRIIHSQVQTIDGVSTHSVGEDENRKIVISPEFRRRSPRSRDAENSSPES